MREAKLISTGPIPVADIDASRRMRPVSPAGVDAIVHSIETTGVMKDEIIVRKVRHQDNRLVLIAGGHRHAAALRLGWDTIAAKVYDCGDDWAELMEIDDNLAHAELSNLEIATFMAARKAAYERAYPETAQGVAGAAARWEDATDIMSFASMIAEKRGMSERHVRRFARIGARLQPATVDALRGATVKFKDLDDLARIEGDEQHHAADQLINHGAKNVKSALRAARGESEPRINPVDKEYDELRQKFARASKAAQWQFLEKLWSVPGTALMLREAEERAGLRN